MRNKTMKECYNIIIQMQEIFYEEAYTREIFVCMITEHTEGSHNNTSDSECNSEGDNIGLMVCIVKHIPFNLPKGTEVSFRL